MAENLYNALKYVTKNKFLLFFFMILWDANRYYKEAYLCNSTAGFPTPWLSQLGDNTAQENNKSYYHSWLNATCLLDLHTVGQQMM